MYHHTTNPAERAVDIADRIAEAEWQLNHDWDRFIAAWFDTYENALREFLHH